MKKRREDLRDAVLLTLASYIPIVCALHYAGAARHASHAGAGGPWGAGAIVSGALGYLLVVDALLPLGRSKIDLARGATRRALEASSRNGWWGARVAVALSCVVATQLFCELVMDR